MQPSHAKNDQNALREEIGKLLSKIDQLYDEIKMRNIEIPVKTRGKIQSVENEIIEEEIRSLKRIIRYYLIIISILEKLLKAPVLAMIFTAITSVVNSILSKISHAFTSTGSKIKQGFMTGTDAVARGCVAIKNGFIGLGRAITLPFKKSDEPIRSEGLDVGETSRKETEKVERVPVDEVRSTGKYTYMFDQNKTSPAEIAEDIRNHAVSPGKTPYGVAESMDVSSQSFRAGADNDRKTPPSKSSATVILDNKPKLMENKQSYLKYAAAVIFPLVIGAALFMLIDNLTCSKGVAPGIAPIKTYSCIDSIDMGKTTPAQLVEAINSRLKNMTYCCFKNMDTSLDSALYESWKEKNLHFIQCISEHLPEGYVLVVKGHANKTGPEEDLKLVLGKENKFLKVLGNFSYSDGRAEAIMSELAREISEDKVLFYGVGSQEPRDDLPVAPEHDSNRRITFKVDKRETLLKEKDELRN